LLSGYSLTLCSQWLGEVVSIWLKSAKFLQRIRTGKIFQLQEFGKAAAFICGIALLASGIYGQIMIDVQ